MRKRSLFFLMNFPRSFEAVIIDFLIVIDVLFRLLTKKDSLSKRRLYALIRALRKY